ncbi:glycosyltransferase family 4 protein [Salinibacter ruber]|uniref:glycosyltransferase family 4 protein n=1 Tax=Salinibacter ruber TaxID=146919 RepID=UPI00311A9725
MEWFDRWCAGRVSEQIDAVICYENSALHTFRAAKRRGLTTILDAASFQHQWQDAAYDPVEPQSAHARIVAHKNREIDLADHILTVSDLARESYLDAGLSEEQVTSVPMGTDLSKFSPPDSSQAAGPDEPFTFLLVGHADRRKGADILREASRLLYEDDVEHRVQVAGHVDKAIFDGTESTIERLGYLDRGELVRAYRQADVLVLPSRFDSFGRVVVEGMSTGLPALVSERVGAKEVLTDGDSGWVVPAEDPEALADQMQWCVQHSTQVATMRKATAAAAEDYTWKDYRRRVTRVLEQVMEKPKSTGSNTGS